MGWWSRARTETRQQSTWGTPRPLTEVLSGLLSRRVGEINLSAAESSLQSVAVRSSVDLIASLASELPLDVFRGKGSQREEVPMSRHPWLEDPDGSEQGLEDWCYRVVVSWLLRGNLYGDIIATGPGGILEQVDIFHPDRVTPTIDEDGLVRWSVQGREVPRGRMLHRRVNPVPGWLLGLSPVSYHAWTIGLSLTATKFGLSWFEDGAHPSGILKQSEKALDPEQAKTVKDRFMAALQGNREPVVLGKGWEWQQLQLNPEESQFLATQGYSAAECCRIFGPGIAEVLGYGSGMEGGGSLTYANIVDRDLHLLKYALGRWLRRLERLIDLFLPAPHWSRFNRDALLETDTLRRYQAHAIALDKRFKTVNDVRDKEDMPRVPWGDEPNPTPGAPPPADDSGDREDDTEGGDE